MNHSALFEPLQLGALTLPNRILMAPLTRARADEGHIPNGMMAKHYSDRASSGLLIAEATMAMKENCAFVSEPGIYNDDQVAGWKNVTDAVHEKGGRIFLQIWHGGRACHSLLNGGRQPVGPSPIAITNNEVHTPEGKKPYEVPRELDDAELPEIIEGFGKAARNAKSAGFDGIEIHGANGYLLDSFLRDSANQRSGPYGGSFENRSRLLLEVINAVTTVWQSNQVGVRISPLNSFNSMRDSDPIKLYSYLAEQLNERKLAYLHLMRSDFLGEQEADIVTPIRRIYGGTLITNMGYSADEAANEIAAGNVDAVAFGTPYLANPDLPERFAKGAELNEPNPDTFYSPGPEGYNDYPKLGD